MNYTIQTKLGTIKIPSKTVINVATKIVNNLSIYKVEKVNFFEPFKGIQALKIYLTNNNSSINYVEYISSLQEKIDSSIRACLNIKNLYSIIVFN